MSSTLRGAIRQEDDFYESPAWAIRAILAELGTNGPTRILEPTAGRGAIVKELVARWPSSSIDAVEIDCGRLDILRSIDGNICGLGGDFLGGVDFQKSYDLGITNPPFKLAVPVIEKTIRLCRETVMLARLNFLASMERDAFWKAHPCDVFVLPKRPSFCASLKCMKTKDKKECGWKQTLYLDAPRPEACPTCGNKIHVTTTDSCEYAFLLWGPGRGGRWKRLAITE